MHKRKRQGKGKRRVTITLSPDVYKELEGVAARRRKLSGRNVSRSGIYEEILLLGMVEGGLIGD